jgi:nucleotide-binding universal stress UspA family protein
MRSYRRILSLIDLTENGESVARRGLQLARMYNAALALSVIVDYTPGFESDHVPFRTPQQMRDAIVRDVKSKLDGIIAAIGAGGAEAVVVAASTPRAMAEIAKVWQPDLVLVGSHAPRILQQPAASAVGGNAKLPFDVLTVQVGRPSLAGRLVNALSTAF